MKIKNIKFSIIASAIREDRYKLIYDNLNYKNNISFEIVFVGDVPPKKEIAFNFRYIYTKVRPLQCLEIAARNAYGEYLLPIGDDFLFSKEFLNRIDFYLSKLYMEKVLVGNRYQTNGVFYDKIMTYQRKIPNSPIIAAMPAFKKDIWNKIGGIDKRFSWAFFDKDIILRFYELGYTPFISPDSWVNEIRNKTIKSFLCKKTERLGNKLNSQFWEKDGLVIKKRKESVISFDDKNILIKNQGETGKFYRSL